MKKTFFCVLLKEPIFQPKKKFLILNHKKDRIFHPKEKFLVLTQRPRSLNQKKITLTKQNFQPKEKISYTYLQKSNFYTKKPVLSSLEGTNFQHKEKFLILTQKTNFSRLKKNFLILYAQKFKVLAFSMYILGNLKDFFTVLSFP